MDLNLTNSNNKTAAPVYTPIDPTVVAYAVVGIGAIISNAVIFATLISDKKLLARSALITGFAVSHLILGINMGTTGIVRLINRAYLKQPMSPLACIQLVYPIGYSIAFQCSALLLCLTGVERLAAVAFPHWFRRWLNSKKMWYLVALVFILVSISIAVGVSYVRYLPITTRQCSQSNIMGSTYTAFGRLASACGGTVAVILTIAALFAGTRRIRKMPLLSGEAGKIRKQIQLTKAMLGVAFVDFCLVVVPNTVSFISAYKSIELPPFMGTQYSNVAFCVNATSALFLYLIFNSQFRHAAAKLFHIPSANTIQTITAANETQAGGSKGKNVTQTTARRV